MADKNNPLLGSCPLCGVNRDLPMVGVAHRCVPRVMLRTAEERAASELRGRKRLPPMGHPESEPIVRAIIDGDVPELQAVADTIPAKKRGRPKKSVSGFDKVAYMREYKRKQRADKKVK